MICPIPAYFSHLSWLTTCSESFRCCSSHRCHVFHSHTFWRSLFISSFTMLNSCWVRNFKEIMFMPGVPKAAYILITLLEILTFCSAPSNTCSCLFHKNRWPLAVARVYLGWRSPAPRCCWFEVNQPICIRYRHCVDLQFMVQILQA